MLLLLVLELTKQVAVSVKRILFVLSLCLLTGIAQAQSLPNANKQEVKSGLSFSERWAFKTNVAEWIATIPNVTVAFDLSPSLYNHSVIQLGLKYNWNTYHKYPPDFVLDLFDIRPEFRWYYRHKPIKKDSEHKGLSKLFNTERKKPKLWRAYYFGVYADYATFSFKPGSLGRQGSAVGVGISYGWEAPLYNYKSGVVDFELGFSAGLVFMKYDGYRLDRNTYSYVVDPAHSHDWHIKPYPVISEIRAVFSWRKKSVKDKYSKYDPSDTHYSEQLKVIKGYFKTKTEYDIGLKEENRMPESLDSSYVNGYKRYIKEELNKRIELVEEHPALNDSHKKKLKSKLVSVSKSMVRKFESDVKEELSSRRKAESEKVKESNQQETDKVKDEKKAEAEKLKAEKEKLKAEKRQASEKAKAEKKAAKEAKKNKNKEKKQVVKETEEGN